ncbi:MAG TPA: hypothetical protein VN886_21505, partial [Acidimicrobiales bacterium]|nr:hypothetical protein [Acidimicrobiales bacterium]
RADLSQMSFAFTVMGGGQSWNNDFSKRELTSLNIHHGDVSIVVNGASPTTWATVDTTEGRKRIADEIGVSVRGFAPFSVEHSVEHADTGLLEVRLAPGTTKIKKCARCGTAGSITLAGQRITCPLCKGKGHNIITSGPTDAPAMSTVTDGRSRSEHERERLVALGWTPKTPRATSATATLVRPSRPDEAQRYERLLRGQRKIDEERKTETPQIGISDDDY